MASSNEHWVTLSKCRKKASQRERGHLGEQTAARERMHQAPSTWRTWSLPENIHLVPPPRLCLVQPAPSKSPAPLTAGRRTERDNSGSPCAESPQLGSSLFRKQSPVKWEALLISAPLPGALFAWQSTGWVLRADDGRMRWEECNKWVPAVVGGGEEDERGKIEVISSHCWFPAKYQFTR